MTPLAQDVPAQFLIIAGPNGSGKSTSAPAVLPGPIPYVNADEIAKGLPEDPARNKDLRAGRILIEELDRLEAERADFAIETTLASRSLVPRIARLQASGYRFHLLFFRVASVEVSIARVAERVRRGGHDIPEPTIRRRYAAGLRNFFSLYLPVADTWRVFDNTHIGDARLVASGRACAGIQIYDYQIWNRMKKEAGDG